MHYGTLCQGLRTQNRNYSMTLGVRDTRKIVGRYNLTRKDVLEEGRFADSVYIFPEFVDGYAILVLPTTGRYFKFHTDGAARC